MLDFVQTQLKQLNGMKGSLGVEVSCMCNELNILFDELLGISEEISRPSEEGIRGLYNRDTSNMCRGSRSHLYGKFGKDHPMSGRRGPLRGRKGYNHPAWKGGISAEPYCEVWQDKEYKDAIKERDGNKCLNPDCSGKVERLCIHHIDYDKKNCHPQNLITLCYSCNAKANGNREWHSWKYQEIIKNRYDNKNF